MNLPQIDDLPESGYLRSMYEFYTGVYYERYRDGTNAVRFSIKLQMIAVILTNNLLST